jgi:hypothetical protein
LQNLKPHIIKHPLELVTIISRPTGSQESLAILRDALKIEDEIGRLIEDHYLNMAIADLEKDNLVK